MLTCGEAYKLAANLGSTLIKQTVYIVYVFQKSGLRNSTCFLYYSVNIGWLSVCFSFCKEAFRVNNLIPVREICSGALSPYDQRHASLDRTGLEIHRVTCRGSDCSPRGA